LLIVISLIFIDRRINFINFFLNLRTLQTFKCGGLFAFSLIHGSSHPNDHIILFHPSTICRPLRIVVSFVCAGKEVLARFELRERTFAMFLDRSVCRVVSVRWLVPVALAAIACLSQSAFAADKVVTDADKGGVIHLKAGERFEVRLKANPTTGFMWYLEKESTPIVKLTHMSQEDVTDGSEDKHLGRPVYQIFNFEAKRFGDGVLQMHYVRSWEKPTPEDEHFTIHVYVH